MSNSLIIQNIKMEIYPFNSYYSYINPNFISEYYSNRNDDNEISKVLKDIYEDIREGTFTTRLDSLKQMANIHWIQSYESLYNEDMEQFTFNSYCNIANKYFKVRNGQIYVDGNKDIPKDINGNKNTFVVGENYNNKFKWYILKHYIDTDILIGAYMVSNGLNEIRHMSLWDSPVFTTETLLEKVLEKGMAELHLHIKASKKFSTIWTTLMNSKRISLSKGTKFKKEILLKKIKIDTHDGKLAFGNYIRSLEIVRIVIALFVEKANFCNQKNFQEFITKDLEQIHKLSLIINDLIKGKKLENLDLEYSVILDSIKKIFNLEYKEVNKEKNFNKKNSQRNYINNILLSEDLLTYIFTDYYDYRDNNILPKYGFESVVMPENILIFKALNYIKKTNHKDKLFTKCFWQYVKLKNVFLKYIVQNYTMGKGLDIFSNMFQQQKGIPIASFLEEAFYSDVKLQNIKKFEFRVGFKDDRSELKYFLIDIFEVYLQILKSNYFINKDYKAIPLIGIVFHFSKKPDDNIENKCVAYYKNTNDKSRLNYGDLEEEYLMQAKDLAYFRRTIPHLDQYLVGVDAASKELVIDPHIFKKAYKELRSLNNSVHNNFNYHSSFIKDIGFTYHVGEEFRDIISGLRKLDEAITILEFKSGDRIGHGIVLGIDVDKWASINSVVYLTTEEYLDNLLWEWNLYTSDRNFKDIENINYIERQIYDVIEYIFGFSDGLRIIDLYKAYQLKLNREELWDSSIDCGCKLKEYTENKHSILKCNNCLIDRKVWNEYLVYETFHCKYFIKEYSKTVTLNIDKYSIDKYKKLQKHMKDKLSKKEIILELNPTSNLLIGEFKTFEDYHITNLSSPKKEEVIVTINTDDPVIFNTKISNEFALIYDILMKTGEYESKEVIDWLDKIRNNGLEYSFIKDRKLTIVELVSEIKTIIEALKKL